MCTFMSASNPCALCFCRCHWFLFVGEGIRSWLISAKQATLCRPPELIAWYLVCARSQYSADFTAFTASSRPHRVPTRKSTFMAIVGKAPRPSPSAALTRGIFRPDSTGALWRQATRVAAIGDGCVLRRCCGSGSEVSWVAF